MNLREAREINGNVARWYMDTMVFGNQATLPPYRKEEMLEAFRIVEKANGFRVMDNTGKRTFHVVCDSRIADMVVQLRGW